MNNIINFNIYLFILCSINYNMIFRVILNKKSKLYTQIDLLKNISYTKFT